jgi:hypothetical protein
VTAVVLAIALCATADARERSPSLRDLRRAVESTATPCRLAVDEELSLGPMKLWFARRVVAMVDDVDPEAKAILAGLRRVEVGSYRITGETRECSIPGRLESDLVEDGWIRSVHVRDGGNRSLVLHRPDDDGGIAAMLVVDIDGRSVDMVRLEGRIGDVLAAAIADDPTGASSLLAAR